MIKSSTMMKLLVVQPSIGLGKLIRRYLSRGGEWRGDCRKTIFWDAALAWRKSLPSFLLVYLSAKRNPYRKPRIQADLNSLASH